MSKQQQKHGPSAKSSTGTHHQVSGSREGCQDHSSLHSHLPCLQILLHLHSSVSTISAERNASLLDKSTRPPFTPLEDNRVTHCSLSEFDEGVFVPPIKGFSSSPSFNCAKCCFLILEFGSFLIY
ncbi:hypothetical protein CEXT_609741 [Caerostris extrusa]|uniref:Uncharacterized protein n=1 Tax=Caerostris extrusa TaxID=172846 RepID=A0AAV4RF57_CAEEX|nr:hypothetical protein CEXT_609741 [Caerostris extrusa]